MVWVHLHMDCFQHIHSVALHGVQWVGELWMWRKGCAVISELLSTCRPVPLIHAIQGQLCVCVSIFFPTFLYANGSITYIL